MTMAKVKRKATKAQKADPIVAALQRHKVLNRYFIQVSRAEEEGRASKDFLDRAGEAADEAAWRMAKTRPTTVAGASAMLTYIACDKSTGFFELGETRWHETAFRTVTAALRQIARQSQRAA
jgi:hypothetical protein